MAVTKKDNSKAPLVVNQLVIKTPTRSTSDVGQWRTALQSADMGKVKSLYNLYDDLLIDGVLSDAIDKRIDAVKLADLTFQDADGQEVDEIATLIDSPGFEALLDTIMQAMFWGRSGGEFNFNVEEGFEFEPLPFKHIRLDNQCIIINDSDETGIDYSTDDHILILGKVRQFGLLLKAAPFAIWKRGGFGDWAEWLEVFGMPQRIGKYSSSDPAQRILLEEAFERAGSAPWMVVPKETDVKQNTEGANSSSNTSYNDFRKACNEELLITILGQTMTTLDGSSRSQSETHKAVEDSKHQKDMKYVQRILNYTVKPLLEARGLKVANGTFVFPEDNEPITVDEIVSLSSIIEIPATFVYNKYGIPTPAEGEDIARAVTTESVTSGIDDGNIEQADHNAFNRLLNFFADAPQAGASTSTTHIRLNDADFSDRIIKHVVQNGDAFNLELFEWISTNLLTALDAKSVKLADLGFKYNYQNDAFRTAQEMNIFHFSAAKTITEVQTLNQLYRDSTNFESFHKAAREKLDVFNKTWQRTEWQSATLISESTANYNRLNKKTDLFPYWKYTAVMDDKTRPEHAALNGLILPANDPRWQSIWPPNGWKCRCYVIPLMAHEVAGIDLKAQRTIADNYLNGDEWTKTKAQGFGVNRALVPKVFTENQLYIKKFPRMAKRLLADVNANTYQLGSPETLRKKAATALQQYEGSIEQFTKGLKQDDGKAFFTDYNDRNIEFNLKGWLKGHSRKINDRVPYLKGVSETLKTPDEVWINAANTNTFEQYVFVKYYTDQTMVVIGNIKEGKVYEVTTWFPLAEKSKKVRERYRKGLLIKKPGN